MQRPHVPKFGNWEGDRDVPYTKYFDNARKGRTGGKLINPNDPLENPEAFSEEASPAHGPPVKTRSDPEVPKTKHERHPSREDGDTRRPMGSPLRHDAMAGKHTPDSPLHSYGDQGEPQRRAGRVSGGSDRSIEQSPLHPHHHAKSGSRGGVSSPSWERKVSSESHGHAPNTPGRSRMRPGGRGEDIPERVSEVPKFGEWDPASAESFTHIFDKVREEKQIGSSKVPVSSNESSYRSGHKRDNSSDSVRCCCFSLGKN